MHATPVSAAAMKEQPPAPGSDEATHVLVYLNSKTFTSEPGSKFAAELRSAKQAGTPLVLVHENDPALGGCEFAKVMEQPYLQSELLPLFTALTRDDQDSVRIVAVDKCGVLGGVLPEETTKKLIFPLIRELHKDKSWRVRYMVAHHFCELCDTVSKDMIESEMTPALVRFLKDTEAEVRTAAALKVTEFSAKVSVQVVMTHLMPCIRELTTDSVQHVRAALELLAARGEAAARSERRDGGCVRDVVEDVVRCAVDERGVGDGDDGVARRRDGNAVVARRDVRSRRGDGLGARATPAGRHKDASAGAGRRRPPRRGVPRHRARVPHGRAPGRRARFLRGGGPRGGGVHGVLGGVLHVLQQRQGSVPPRA